MGPITRVITLWHGGMLLALLTAALLPGTLLGGEVAQPSPGTAATHPEFVLMVQEGRLSLRAQDASLKAIVEAIG
jgi:hypothetical protein